MTLENAVGADVDPEVVRGLHDVADALTALGHEVVEDAPALPGPDSLDIFLDVFGPMVAVGIGYGETLAGRPPTEDEIEPLSRAVLEHARTLSSTAYLTAVAQLQVLARHTVAFFADYDVLLTPVLATRPLPIGELTAAASSRWTTCGAPAASPRSRRCSTSPASPRCRCPRASGRTGCPARCSSSATRWRRRRCCRSRPSWRPPGPGPERRPAMADGA